MKLVDKFTYLGSIILSCKRDVNILPVKMQTGAHKLSIIWKSDRIKQHFFQTVSVFVLLFGCTLWMLTKLIEKRIDAICTKKFKYSVEQIQEVTPHKRAAVQPLTSHLKKHPSKTNKPC